MRKLTIVLGDDCPDPEIQTLEDLAGYLLNELVNADIPVVIDIEEVPASC